VSDRQPAGATHAQVPGSTPPSAVGFMEPYGVRLVLAPSESNLDVEPFLKTLLEDVATACMAEGASLIGHLKCLLRAGSGRVSCNLTSVRSGAVCRGDRLGALAMTDGAELDLAVLVYGLPAATIDRVVLAALDKLLRPARICWAKKASSSGREEACGRPAWTARDTR